MKLLFCTKCSDIFKLNLGEVRSCDCGHVYGRYVDNTNAEVSDTAISLAIGNGSLLEAIMDAKNTEIDSAGAADREEYYEEGKGKIDCAWVRPNSGPGNPHCTVITKYPNQ